MNKSAALVALLECNTLHIFSGRYAPLFLLHSSAKVAQKERKRITFHRFAAVIHVDKT